ncbi:response regulator transcription factor [Aliikangiella coralliicola]|uniref:Response regulator transcription factor n=1 Tax=Aliikangiella coralliicola TaxID=2592383 RepID=A0A545U680_9GAMM|nr:response regulator [Aliikangiella coralliicola]TQV84979.1 response regulator transcription factor [Aliikangiella coralliicola]
MAIIFWVEDQFHWIDKFKPVLESADFGDKENTNQVEVHKFVESACQAIKQRKLPPDIVILDANMNGNDDAGFTVSKLLVKKWPQVPVIYLSEHSGTGIEEKAFEQTDAQDFIAKHQLNVEKVLCWRIKALLRHKVIQNESDKMGSSGPPDNDMIKSGELTIDLTTWNVYWQGERLMNPINNQRPLAPTPRKILKFLVESSPRPLTTFQMAEKLDSDKFSYANYRQHIKTLRHSFEQASLKKQTSFLQRCKNGKGIVTFGDEGAYLWVK